MDSLVSVEWLAHELASGQSGAGDLRIVDASLHMPDSGRNAAAEFEAGHIPGAVFLNLAKLVDASAPIEATAPDAQTFASRMRMLGIGDDSRIVLYDDSAIRTAARAWFLLRMFGAHNVAILDGGLAGWKAGGHPLGTGQETPPPQNFTARQDAAMLRSKQQVLSHLGSPHQQVADARGPGRFAGAEAEPRAGIMPGHIPGARNVPYASLFNPDGTYKAPAAIRSIFAGAGIDLEQPVVTSCGSGMTACVLAFAMHLAGKDDVALYDGSWAEWGSDPETPKQTGPAA